MSFNNLNQLTPNYIADMKVRFAKKYIVLPNGCHQWTCALVGPRIAKGHGYGGFGVTINGRSLIRRAHRVAYIIKHGSLANGAMLEHSCHNTKCVNVDHLSIGSSRTNTKSAHVKGSLKMPRGSKWSDADRIIIKAKILAGVSAKELHKLYGIDSTTVSGIKSGRDWANV